MVDKTVTVFDIFSLHLIVINNLGSPFGEPKNYLYLCNRNDTEKADDTQLQEHSRGHT